MKIHFSYSPRAIEKCELEFNKIFHIIERLGHENLNDLEILRDSKKFYSTKEEDIQRIHVILTKKIRQADILVIETTIHSLTMGFYTKMGLDLDKPVILLHQPGSKPFYFAGIQNDRLQIIEYTLENLEEVLSAAIEYASESLDIRFNLMINPELNEYLKWAAHKNGTPRSIFVRNLILQHKQTHLNEYMDDMKK